MVVPLVTSHLLTQPNQSKTVLGAFPRRRQALQPKLYTPLLLLGSGTEVVIGMSGRNFVDPKAL